MLLGIVVGRKLDGQRRLSCGEVRACRPSDARQAVVGVLNVDVVQQEELRVDLPLEDAWDLRRAQDVVGGVATFDARRSGRLDETQRQGEDDPGRQRHQQQDLTFLPSRRTKQFQSCALNKSVQ